MINQQSMYVIKRKGHKEPVNFGKIQQRIQWMKSEPYLLENVNDTELAQTVIQGLRDDIHTSDIDTYAAQLCESLSSRHTDYGILAGRIAINNHHKKTLNSFKDKVDLLYFNKDVNEEPSPLVSDEFYKFVKKHHFKIDKHIDYSRDYDIDYFGFRTLQGKKDKNGYLMRISNKIIERPQDVFMRTAIGIHMNTHRDHNKVLELIFQTYDNISQQYYTHASPTLFNSGIPKGNLSSCFLLGSDDSLEGIMKTLTDSAHISKRSGGIGIHVSNWRGQGSLIRGTNGKSSGVVPFLKIGQSTAKAFNQGGKRPGSFAFYLEPHHPDIFRFLKIGNKQGDEDDLCRDLYFAVWISDLFMKRVQNNEKWSLLCPDQCPGLNDVWGDEYEKLYLKYESEGKVMRECNARDLWLAIFHAQKESGMPYIGFKDTVNRSNMQSNIGIIRSSNLCSEVLIYSDKDNYGTCNLSSICLPKFVEDSYSPAELEQPENERRELNHEFPKHPVFNYPKLAEIAGELVVNLNNVIDKNYNVLIEIARTNYKNRPIGMGVQGLADVFLKFRIPFDSDKARDLNKKIFETIYYGAVSKSSEICRERYKEAVQIVESGKHYSHRIFPKEVLKQFPDLKKEDSKEVYKTVEEIPKTIGAYSTYEGSPISTKFHWEMCGLTEKDLSGMFDWETLREHINQFGVYNSLLVALMPTASTSQIMGCSPCFEPYDSNLFKRTTQVGQFIVVNKYLIRELQEFGVWNDVKDYILAGGGSIQNIDGIADEMKNVYKTAWEIKQKALVDLAADRQPFIDQAQSMNLFMEQYDENIFNSLYFYGWKRGLKTGSYYVYTRPATRAQKFTIDPEIQEKVREKERERENEIANTMSIYDNTDNMCLMCGS